MKKSKELIEALLAEAKPSSVAALIVRLPRGDEYVFCNTKPSPLAVLDKMMEGGGKVLAVAAVKRGTLNHVTAYARPLDEFVSNPVLLNTLALRFQRYVEYHSLPAAN
jgi:hypothetical protein